MSVESMAIVLHHSRARGTAKLILVGIANHDGDGGAWPTLRTLARYANIQPRNARKALRRLEELQEVRVHLQAGGLPDWDDYDRPNRYEVLVTCPPGCDRSKHHRMVGEVRTPPLWINPRTKATPPDESDRGAPDAGDPLTVPTTPTTPGSASTTGHARDDRGPMCSTCSQVERRCQAVQVKWKDEHRHPFTPREDRR